MDTNKVKRMALMDQMKAALKELLAEMDKKGALEDFFYKSCLQGKLLKDLHKMKLEDKQEYACFVGRLAAVAIVQLHFGE